MALDTRYVMIDNYIYLFHTNTLIVVPSFVDSINDTMQVSYSSSTPLSRSAPIYSYQNSGPRQIRVEFNLHRDLMKEINYGVSNAPLDLTNPGVTDDYVNFMVKAIQAAALPSYDAATKMVNPPVVAVRLGGDIFIKGVVTGDVGVTYNLPIIEGGHYASVRIAFSVSEIDPYSADEVIEVGSYRGVPRILERFSYTDLTAATSNRYFNSVTGRWVTRTR